MMTGNKYNVVWVTNHSSGCDSKIMNVDYFCLFAHVCVCAFNQETIIYATAYHR